MDRHQAQLLVEDFIVKVLQNEEWYIAIKPHVKASLLYGSVAKGTNTKNSDIDVMLVLPLSIEEKYTSGEYFYIFKNHTINIVLRSIEKLRKISEANNDNFQRQVFKDSVILNSKDNEVKRLLENFL